MITILKQLSDNDIEYFTLSFDLLSDAVLDAVGCKTDIQLLKVLQTEVKPNRREARIVVCYVKFVCSFDTACVFLADCTQVVVELWAWLSWGLCVCLSVCNRCTLANR